jgi:hypothetical protein
LTLKLHTEGNDDIETFKTWLKAIEHLYLTLTERSSSEVFRHQRLRPNQSNLITESKVRPYATARDTRVANITDVPDLESLDSPSLEMLSHRKEIQERLRRVFMLTISRVHDRCVREALRGEAWSSALRVSHHENIWLH